MQGSGQSSLSIWTAFDAISTAMVRQPKWKVEVAWNRVADTSNYATVGSSLVDGTDIVAGGESVPDIINADAFNYDDETARVIRVEYERSLLEPMGGTSIALCDVLFDNTDLRFTPGYDPSIGTALRPNRPLKIFIGFEVNGQEKLIPIMEGLTVGQIEEDKMKRVARLKAYDYMKWLNEKPQETSIYQSQRSDEIIEDILSNAGIGSTGYSLDQGLNTVGFAWFEKGQTAGNRIRQICEAEEAIFYQGEDGTLHFDNRDKYAVAPYTGYVWTIDPADILDWQGATNSAIINRAIVKAKPRTVKGESEIWRDGIEEEIPAGQSVTIWASFDNPVSGITAPSSGTDYKAFTGSGGAGSDITADIDIVLTSFTKTAKLVITNNNGSTAYMNLLKLRGTPATVDYEIEEVFEDTTSIADYNENQEEIDNDFIDDRSFAQKVAQMVVRKNANPIDRLVITIRGIPQIQLRDWVRVKDQDLDEYLNYRVMKIQGILDSGSFIQNLYLRKVHDNETAS